MGRSKFLKDLEARLVANPGNILLPEGNDPRVIETAYLCLSSKITNLVILLGDQEKMIDLIKESEHRSFIEQNLKDGLIKLIDRNSSVLISKTKTHLEEVYKKKKKDVTQENLYSMASLTQHQGAYLLSNNEAEACVAGCVLTTADVIRAGLTGVGLKEGLKTVSSSFLMNRNSDQKSYIYTDCGVVIDPTPEQLVDITASSIETFKTLLPETKPVVAFLSFSTKGSAKHPRQKKMEEAYNLFKEKYPEIESEGELQFDAAIDESIGGKKAPGSSVPGRANIFVFPDLDSGNIAYKITQRLAGFEAFGPILQGLDKPYSDLSRGATAEDIYASCVISILRARRSD